MKQSRRIISILLAVCFIMCGMINVHAEGETQATSVWNGEVSTVWYDANPDSEVFYIETAEELAGLAKLVNEGTDDFSEQVIYLDSNIDLNTQLAEDVIATPPANSWTPIGNTAYAFKGTFDGNGYTISGIYYNNSGSSSNKELGACVGLFGCVENATICAVSLTNGFIYAAGKTGGIVGYAKGATVNNCYSDITIKISGKRNGYGGFGGIVGYSDTNAVAVDGCWFAGRVYNSASSTGYGNMAGGIVGALYSGENVIANCLITGEADTVYMVGGVVGAIPAESVQLIIKNTVMIGTVNVDRDHKTTFGGEFIGYANGGTVTLLNVYGKDDFAIVFPQWETYPSDYTEPTFLWSYKDNAPAVTGLTQNDTSHRKSAAEIKALVGSTLAAGEWTAVDKYAYPVPAYFAPAQFMAVQLVDTEGEYYKARFIGTIGDTTGYDSVGYEVIIWDGVSPEAKKFDLEDATVYTSILANADLEEVSVEGKSLIALTIDNIPEACYKYQIRTFVAKDGVRIYGKTVTLDRPDNWK